MTEYKEKLGEHPIIQALHDIDKNLDLNTLKTDTLVNDLKEVKEDVKAMRDTFVTRREFEEKIKDITEEVSPLKKWIYGIMVTVGLAVLGAVLSQVII